MIKVNEKITIPSNWGDLTPEQVIGTIELSISFLKGKFNLTEYRFLLLQLYTGYQRSKKRFSPDDREQINSNLFLLADMIKFPIRPVYKNPEYLEVLSYPLRIKLKTLFPFEITGPNELDQLVMVADKLEYYPVLNLNLKQNPVPVIKTSGEILLGGVFSIDKYSDVQTNITALQYTEAYNYYRNYIDTGEPDYLDVLMAILYLPNNTHFNLFAAQNRAAKVINKLDPGIKLTVFYWFQSLMEWIFAHPVYGMLFTGGKNSDKKISLGMAETIYSLSKEGYGTLTELGNETVIEFLNKQVKRLRDMVNDLRAADVKIAKIMQKTGLNADTLNKL